MFVTIKLGTMKKPVARCRTFFDFVSDLFWMRKKLELILVLGTTSSCVKVNGFTRLFSQLASLNHNYKLSFCQELLLRFLTI